MQQLLATGAISKLPEEVQWNVRVLLPRGQDNLGSGQQQGNMGSMQNLSAGVLASLPLAAPAATQTPPVVRKPPHQHLEWVLAQKLLESTCKDIAGQHSLKYAMQVQSVLATGVRQMMSVLVYGIRRSTSSCKTA